MHDSAAELKKLKAQLDRAVAGRRSAEAQTEGIADAFAKAQAEASKAKSDLRAAQASIKARFEELGIMTKLLKETEDASSAMSEKCAWIVELYFAQTTQPWWWALLPKQQRMRRKHNRLLRAKIFDTQKYLELYPDVAADGMDPVRHYILHGMFEGRKCPR